MSITVDQVVQRYTLDNKFSGPARHVTKSTSAIADAQQSVMTGTSKLGGALGQIAGTVLNAFMGAVAAAGTALVAFSTYAFNAYAELDSLKRGLAVFTDSAAQLTDQLSVLETVAKLPGLGFKEAIQGATRLQAAGFDFTLAARALSEFGNAIATVGGGKAELDGVTLALSQIASKAKLSAEEINQIAERIPQMRQLMKGAFGTADTEAIAKSGVGPQEFIKRIIDELAKMPRVAGGAKNGIENIGDAFFRMAATAGEALAVYIVPALDRIGSFFDYLTKSGVIKNVFETLGGLLSGEGTGDGLVNMLALVIAGLKNIPPLVSAIAGVVTGFMKGVVGVINQVISFMNRLQAIPVFAALMGFQKMMLLGPVGINLADAGQTFVEDTVRDAGKIKSGFANFKSTSADVPKSGGDFRDPDKSAITPIDNMLDAIKKNTAATASNTQKQLDLSRYTLGGGDVAALGVTPIEVRRAKQGGTVDIRVTGADDAINRLLAEMLRKTLPLLGGRA